MKASGMEVMTTKGSMKDSNRTPIRRKTKQMESARPAAKSLPLFSSRPKRPVV